LPLKPRILFRFLILREVNPLFFDDSTIGCALRQAKQQIAPVSESASLDAQLLLCAVLGVARAYLLAHPEVPLTPEQAAQFAALVEGCAAGEPIAYILGRRAFYDREFIVTPDVLIPRPETELLLEQALAFVKQYPQAVVIDVGTGSGALAVTLAAHCPEAQVYALDISPAALAVARRNAEAHRATVRFMQSDLLTAVLESGIKADMVMANLPYIASDELPTLAVSRYEPKLALDGGPDGLDLIRRLLAQCPAVCNPGALILLEIGATQGAATLALVNVALRPRHAEVLKDYAELDRIVRADMI
jgi:release factor glutamine methyltransferase